ncbi:MAG: sigma-70 family RNA polymerase sigma factor, partial [Crocinitomicaceae bacterium]|nr:sigma-70 family RNA polymerase sigma factor [Crocinitomicaceae bacterium]
MKNFEDIFQSTFKENKDRIFRICRSYTDKNADAEDLFQEVLLNVWK